VAPLQTPQLRAASPGRLPEQWGLVLVCALLVLGGVVALLLALVIA
jgi:hypothetical protein